MIYANKLVCLCSSAHPDNILGNNSSLYTVCPGILDAKAVLLMLAAGIVAEVVPYLHASH